jgi:hypothetical protein
VLTVFLSGAYGWGACRRELREMILVLYVAAPITLTSSAIARILSTISTGVYNVVASNVDSAAFFRGMG